MESQTTLERLKNDHKKQPIKHLNFDVNPYAMHTLSAIYCC